VPENPSHDDSYCHTHDKKRFQVIIQPIGPACPAFSLYFCQGSLYLFEGLMIPGEEIRNLRICKVKDPASKKSSQKQNLLKKGFKKIGFFALQTGNIICILRS
jgi:hypothetical protein